MKPRWYVCRETPGVGTLEGGSVLEQCKGGMARENTVKSSHGVYVWLCVRDILPP